MTREVSVRTSGPPEWKGAIRPDVIGLKRLDTTIVRDEPDILAGAAATDAYLLTLQASEGPSKQMDTHHVPRPRVAGERTPNG